MKRNDLEIGIKVIWENDPYIVKNLGLHYITLVNSFGNRFTVGYENVSKIRKAKTKQFTIKELTNII